MSARPLGESTLSQSSAIHSIAIFNHQSYFETVWRGISPVGLDLNAISLKAASLASKSCVFKSS